MIRSSFLVMTCLVGTTASAQTWRAAYGAYGPDEAVAVRWVNDDRIVVAGSTGSFGNGSSDIYLFAVDGDGSFQWSRTIGGQGVDQASCMAVLDDESILIGGFSNGGDAGYDGLLVKTDPDGNVLWQRTYGGADWDFIRDILPAANGDILLVGQTYSHGHGGQAWLVRVDETGELQEEHTYGADGEENCYAICGSTDGFMLAGSTGIDDGTDALLIHVDAEGEQVWSRTYGGDSSDVAHDVVATLDGGTSFVGITRSSSQWEEAYHVKVDAAGNEQWSRNWGQINDQGAYEHLELENGEFLIAGYTKTSGGGGMDMFLQKSSSSGDFLFGRTFGGIDDDAGYGLDASSAGFLCAGWTTSFGAGARDVFVVRTDEEGTTASQIVEDVFDPLSIDQVASERLDISPNPSTGVFTIGTIGGKGEWRVLDMCGRELGRGLWSGTATSVGLAVGTGRYILEIRSQAGARWRGDLVITSP